MEEEFSKNKNINNKNEITNINKFSLLKEIDSIIIKSKIELEEIQSKIQKFNGLYLSEKNNSNNEADVIEIINNKNNSSNNNLVNNESQLNNKDNNNNELNKDFDLERINLKLTSDLTMERAKVRDLEIQLNLKEKEISSLKKQLNFTQMNFYNRQKLFEKILDQKENKAKNFQIAYKNKDFNQIQNSNAQIVKSFFNFFNKYLELFNRKEILDNNSKNKLLYIENDINNLNVKNASFAINAFDILIDKVIQENKELLEKLLKYENKNYIEFNESEKNFENFKNKNNKIFKDKLLDDESEKIFQNKIKENTSNKVKKFINNEIEQNDNNHLIHNDEYFVN